MDREQFRILQSRRRFFRECAGGIGTIALAQLLAGEGRASAPAVNPLAPKPPHFAPKETERLAKYFDTEIGTLGGNPKAAGELFPAPLEGVRPQEAAAWVGVSRVILNLDEFITRE